MMERRETRDFLETQLDKFVFRVRRGYLYTQGDLWVSLEGGLARVGVTDLLQRLSGDVAFVKFAEVGVSLAQGDRLAEIETVKTTQVLPAPLPGKLLQVNEELTDRPELVNEDPYGEGWLALVEPTGDAGQAGLLDAEAYFALMQQKLAEEDRKRRGA